MYRSIRFRTVIIVLALLFSIATTTSNGAQTARPPEMQGIHNTVLHHLNDLDGSMENTYQAIALLMKEANETKEDMKQERMVRQNEKTKSAQESIEAKRREVERERQAALDAWNAACTVAIASCTAIAGGVATTNSSLGTLYNTPNEQGLQRFTENADALKKRLTKLNGEISRLRDILNSGKLGSVPKNDLEKMKTQLDNSLQQLRNMKRFSIERARKRKDE